MKFNNLKHAKDLCEAEGIIIDAQMLAEGLRWADGCLGDEVYATLSRGAFGALFRMLDRAHELVGESGTAFVSHSGLSYPLDRCKEDAANE